MKLTKKSLGSYSHLNKYIGRLKGVKYEVTETHEGFLYVMAEDTKNGVSFYSLWLKQSLKKRNFIIIR